MLLSLQKVKKAARREKARLKKGKCSTTHIVLAVSAQCSRVSFSSLVDHTAQILVPLIYKDPAQIRILPCYLLNQFLKDDVLA